MHAEFSSLPIVDQGVAVIEVESYVGFGPEDKVMVRIVTQKSITDDGMKKHVERELKLSKHEARAIASAMMGCAAEL